jgi:hypothetical protein
MMQTQDSRSGRERAIRRAKQRKKKMIERYVSLICAVILCVGFIVWITVGCSSKGETPPAEEQVSNIPTVTETPTTKPEEIEEPVWGYGDPNNDVYPYCIMSKDWGAEVYEEGYRFYDIPTSYKMSGGMFPEVAQVYLWCICRDAGVDYYTVLAIIERESGYRYDATGDNGSSKGLMQIWESNHLDRMEALGVDDLYNPYSNMRVGVNFLAELNSRYLESSGAHCVLMAYNMGASGANKLWAKGIYSTTYTKQILQRAQEIKQEIQDQQDQ